MTDLTSLFADLVRLETRVYNVVDARLRAEHDLPLGQFEFMRYIAAHGTARVYDLAHEIAITVGATSKAVDRLEAAGRCRRTANPGDRRSSLVELTATRDARSVLRPRHPPLDWKVYGVSYRISWYVGGRTFGGSTRTLRSRPWSPRLRRYGVRPLAGFLIADASCHR